MQKTEVTISGSAVPWQLWLLVILLAALVIGLIVWLFRGVRKTIQADDQWHYDEYSLMKAGPHQPTRGTDASSGALAEPSIMDELAAKPEPEICEPSLIQPVFVEPPQPPQSVSASPTEPASPKVERPAPAYDRLVSPVEPVQPTARLAEPATATETAQVVVPEHGSQPQPSGSRAGQSFFQSFVYEVQQEHRRRTTQLVVGGAIVILVAVYLLVFPVQDAVNTAVAGLGQRLSRLLQPQPMAPAPLATLPQLDIVQEVTAHASEVTITGRVRNLSDKTLSHLFAEIALSPVGVELTETRLVPIQPSVLPPHQEGTYRLEISGGNFSKYQLARILTADQQEITFRLSLALPARSAPQP